MTILKNKKTNIYIIISALIVIVATSLLLWYSQNNYPFEIVIPYQFDEAENFSEGLAAVQLNQKSGYIDKTGKIVIPLSFDHACNFSDGLASVRPK